MEIFLTFFAIIASFVGVIALIMSCYKINYKIDHLDYLQSEDLVEFTIALGEHFEKINVLIGKVERLERTLGRDVWDVKVKGEPATPNQIKKPTLTERMAYLEDFMGIEFHHSFDENKGYELKCDIEFDEKMEELEKEVAQEVKKSKKK